MVISKDSLKEIFAGWMNIPRNTKSKKYNKNIHGSNNEQKVYGHYNIIYLFHQEPAVETFNVTWNFVPTSDSNLTTVIKINCVLNKQKTRNFFSFTPIKFNQRCKRFSLRPELDLMNNTSQLR